MLLDNVVNVIDISIIVVILIFSVVYGARVGKNIQSNHIFSFSVTTAIWFPVNIARFRVRAWSIVSHKILRHILLHSPGRRFISSGSGIQG